MKKMSKYEPLSDPKVGKNREKKKKKKRKKREIYF